MAYGDYDDSENDAIVMMMMMMIVMMLVVGRMYIATLTKII